MLDAWFPFQAFKQFPPFPVVDLHWESTPRLSEPAGWDCAVRQRGHGEFIFWVRAAQKVAFTLRLQRVGKSGTPETSVTVVTPSGERNSLSKLTGEGEKAYTFQAGQAGPHRLVCEPGNSTVQIISCNLPICLYSEQAPFHLLGTTGAVYFCVPAGVQEFAVRISGEGEGESVRATVYDAAGRTVGEEDSIQAHQFLLHHPSTAGTEIWRLQLAKPSQGIVEDYYVQLQGIPPLLATRPEALPGVPTSGYSTP
jgi:hypothetical protein